MTKKAKIVMFLVCAVAVACILGGLRGRRSRQRTFEGTATFVDDLVSDRVGAQDVLSVTFIQRKPGVDTVADVHAVTSRTAIAEIISELISALRKDVYRGHIYKNHPASLPPPIGVRVAMKDGSEYQSYILFGHNWDGESYYYAVLRTWPRIRANADFEEASRYWLHDHSIQYESRELVTFMEVFSPFLPDDLEAKRRPKEMQNAAP